MTEEQKRLLRDALWKIANDLRGKMDADEFRDYILGFIFFRYLSERMQMYANGILAADGITYGDIREGTDEGEEYLDAIRAEAVEELGYFLRPSELFEAVAAKGAQKGNNFILDDLSRILTNIQKSTMGTESEEDFDHLFEDMDLGSTKLGRTVADRNDLVAKVMGRLSDKSRIDFQLNNAESDVLGDAYEYLIAQFASGAGKKAGEFYTPQQVSTILARIVTNGKTRLESVYDPTCGSGSLLLRVAREVGIRNIAKGFVGQELNRTTYNLARMNMILHGVHYRQFDLKQEDTLVRPQHEGRQFEAVVANPPFSADWSADPSFTTDDRFSTFGRLPPASKADYAFVLHMLHHLADNGTMAVILPHGALFRGGSEGAIRKLLIAERNWLDAVIGLPANIFYGTTIPTCIMVFKKCRENADDILFIDASGPNSFEKSKSQNSLRDSDAERIIVTYRDREASDGYSYVAKMAEIEENDWNLNIPRYVDTVEEEARINLDAVLKALKKVELGTAKINTKIAEFCAELGIEPPAGSNASLLRQYKNGMMQCLFDQSLRFNRNDGISFPDWENKRIDEIATVVGGGTPDTGVDIFWSGDIPWFTPTEIKTKYLDTSIKMLTLEGLKSSSAKLLPVGALLLSTRANVGDVGIARRECATNQGFQSLVMKGKNVNEFWYQWILYHKRKFIKWAAGSTFLEINKTEVSKIKAAVPHPDEQRKIANFLGALDDKIAAVSS